MDLRPVLDILNHLDTLSPHANDRFGEFSMPRGAFAPAIAEVVRKGDGRLQVAVTTSGREAEDLRDALRAYIPAENMAIFPAWETLPHERLSPRSDTVAERLTTLRRLARPEEFPPLSVLLIPIRAFLQPIAAGLGELEPVTLRVGDLVEIGRASCRERV